MRNCAKAVKVDWNMEIHLHPVLDTGQTLALSWQEKRLYRFGESHVKLSSKE